MKNCGRFTKGSVFEERVGVGYEEQDTPVLEAKVQAKRAKLYGGRRARATVLRVNGVVSIGGK